MYGWRSRFEVPSHTLSVPLVVVFLSAVQNRLNKNGIAKSRRRILAKRIANLLSFVKG
jgi:hypothetical protein